MGCFCVVYAISYWLFTCLSYCFPLLPRDWREGIEVGIYNRIDTFLDIAIARIERTSYCCDFSLSQINLIER